MSSQKFILGSNTYNCNFENAEIVIYKQHDGSGDPNKNLKTTRIFRETLLLGYHFNNEKKLTL